jgi:SAM-dependent methyltransferase
MNDCAEAVSRHYSHGALETVINEGLTAMGSDLDRLTIDDLAPIDEFHMGGRRATTEIAERLQLDRTSEVLDVGSGLGGPARYFATIGGCKVTGVDLTPEYVDVARSLTNRVGLGERVDFQAVDASRLPFVDGAFNRATLLHVGMNIRDKPALFREVARALRQEGLFVAYDVMRVGPGELSYPLAWANDPSTSFVESPESYRAALLEAGFELLSETNRQALALEMFRALAERFQSAGLPPLGLHVLMGETAREKVKNMIRALEGGVVAPVELICRRR